MEETKEQLVRLTEELRKTNDELRRSRDFYMAQFDNLPAAVWQADLDGKCVHFNRTWLEFTGRTMEQELGDGWAQGVHPDDAANIMERYRAAHKSRQPFQFEYRLRRHDGEYRMIVDYGSPLHDVEGRFVGYVGACYDITDRHRAEEALRRREAQLAEAQELVHLGSWDWVIDEDVLSWSAEVFRMFGIFRENFAANMDAFRNCIHPADRARVDQARDEALAGRKVYNLEYRIVPPDGSVRRMHSRGRVTCDAAGKPVRMAGVVQDITERKESEQELKQTKDRLEVLTRRLLETSEAELRRIARELHDEIGQSLTAAKLEIQAAKRMTDPAALALRLDDGLAIIEHLLQCVRELSLTLRPASLDALGLAGAIKAHAAAQATRAGLKLRFDAEELVDRFDSPLEISCFRVAQEALTNIIRHAKASSVTIELRRIHSELQLRVRDDGSGFDFAAAMEGAENGASFGLISMKERVELSGGRFMCVSTPGAGTEIQAFFCIGREDAARKR